MTTSFHDLLRVRAAEDGEKKGFIFVERDDRERSLTFETLYDRARQVAALLQRSSVPNERVLLMFPPSLDFVPAFYGSMLAGTTSVAVYPPDPRLGKAAFAGLLAIATDAGASLILAPRAIAQMLAGQVPCAVVAFDDALELLPSDYRPRLAESDTLAYLQYTSGSTGNAKGVQITHGNLLEHCRQFVEGFGMTRDDRTISWLPVHHSFGLIAGVVVPLFLGQTCVQMSPLAFLEKPSRWAQAMSKYQGTVSGGPNFAFDLCARATPPAEMASLDLSKWRVAGLGGEPVRADTLRRFAAAFAPAGFDPRAFRPGLGISEGTLSVTANPEFREPLVVEFDVDALERGRVVAAGPETKRRRTLVGLGRPLRGQSLEIVAEPGAEIGEVLTAGANISPGYWNRPAENARVFGAKLPGRPEAFLRTGDLGFLYRGELFLVGRAKDLIIIRGCNYHPHDIEQTVEGALGAPPQSVAAFSVDGPEGEELVVAVEVQGDEGAERLGQLTALARAALSEQHNLRCRTVLCVRRGTLPRTASAKLQRSEGRRRFLAGELAGVYADEAAAPVATAAEPATLVELLAHVLRIDPSRIAEDAPLASLGLDSMATVELHELAREKLGLDVPYEVLLGAETRVADLLAGHFSAHTEVPIESRVGLPEGLVPSWRGQPEAKPGAPEHILVTGATGYLGAHLVAELVRQTSARVVCLVRAKSDDEARRRLAEAFARHPSLADVAGGRVTALRGDFTQPRFGLSESAYEELASTIDTVVHSGAWVNFIYPYAVLERANVTAFEEVLRFAALGRRKAVHHMSSTAVLFSPGYERGQSYPEQGPLLSDGKLPNGYEQTKWVADKNVEIARERGFVVSNYRVGYVTGASDDGRDFRLSEFFPAMIKGCIQLGVAPSIDTNMTMVPIDYAAAAIARIITRPEAENKTFHINHPDPVHFGDVVRWIRAYGYPLETTDFDSWRDLVTAKSLSDLCDNALAPYLGFVRNLEEQHVWLPPVETSDTRAAAEPIRCPPSYELLATYFAMFHRVGFLTPPTKAAPG